MTWPDVFTILPAPLPKCKMCNYCVLRWLGRGLQNWALVHHSDRNILLNQRPITWAMIQPLDVTLCNHRLFWHFTEYQPRCETLVIFALANRACCILDASYSAHINVQLPMLAECNSNRSFTTIPFHLCAVCRYRLEPVGTILSYIDAAFDE